MTNDELTRDEAVALADDLGIQLYRAEDRIAFVREMLAGRTGTVDVADVLAWLDHQHCARVESEQQQIKRLTAERDQLAARVAELEQHQADDTDPAEATRWDVHSAVTPPTPDDAQRWAGTIRDLVFGDSMQLDVQIRARYADAVNAPLRPETIAALNDRLASGDHPVRRVPTAEER